MNNAFHFRPLENFEAELDCGQNVRQQGSIISPQDIK
jgi:hypothetical protein